MRIENRNKEARNMTKPLMKGSIIRLAQLMIFIIVLVQLEAQNPNWSVNYPDFQNTMTAIVSMSDDCVPSIGI